MPEKINRLMIGFAVAILTTGLTIIEAADDGGDLHLDLNIDKTRIDGLLTLTAPYSNSIDKTIYSFTEHIDSSAQRSVVSIAALGDEPVDYHYVKEVDGLLYSKALGECKSLKQTVHTPLVPELNEFVQQMAPGLEIVEYLRKSGNPHAVGPLAFIVAMMYKVKLDKAAGTGSEQVRRNVDCNVHSYSFNITTESNTVSFMDLNVFIPRNSLAPVAFVGRRLKSEASKAPATHTFEMDITDTEQDIVIVDTVRRESKFNLPLHSGCSRFYAQDPTVFEKLTQRGERDKRQMSLVFTQSLSATTTMVAIDSKSGFMRREHLGRDISVWDSQASLLYHTELEAHQDQYKPRQDNSSRKPTPRDSNCSKPSYRINRCAVLSLVDPQLPAVLRPFDSELGSINASVELNPLRFLLGSPQNSIFAGDSSGKLTCAYIGVGYVRELPVSIYETVSKLPPRIVSLNLERAFKPEAAKIYITTLYLFESGSSESDGGWWPARIMVHQLIGDKSVWLDTIDIYDFSWSLLGWPTRPADMFGAAECFRESSEDRRGVELMLELGDSYGDRQMPLAKIKYELELGIQEAVVETLGVQMQHIVDLKVNFRGSKHLVARFQIIDRPPESELTLATDTGRLLEMDNTNGGNVLSVLYANDPSSCAMAASVLSKVSLVAFCPSEGPACTVIVEDGGFELVDRSERACTIFKLSNQEDDEERSMTAVNALLVSKEKLVGKTIKLADASNGATIVDYELQETTKLNSVLDKVFIFDSANNNNGDSDIKLVKSRVSSAPACEALCNLDAQCKSYFYCPLDDSGKASSEYQCGLTKVDVGEYAWGYQTDAKTEQRVQVLVSGGRQYPVRAHFKCKIVERNYLTLYRATREFVRVPRKLTRQFEMKSAFECARQGALLEARDRSKHIAMFAICVRSSGCILDEEAINNHRVVANDTKSADEHDDGDSEFELCVVHRKRYQTYFHPSLQVLPANANTQVLLKLPSVEECARVCWIKMGDKCASFDHCLMKNGDENNCVISTLDAAGARVSGIALETREGCYHYERDFELDKLQRELDLGKHQIYDEINRGPGKTAGGRGWVWIVGLLVLPCGFVFGLWVGGRTVDAFLVNRRLQHARAVQATTGATDIGPFHAQPELRLEQAYSSQDIQMTDIGSSQKAQASQNQAKSKKKAADESDEDDLLADTDDH